MRELKVDLTDTQLALREAGYRQTEARVINGIVLSSTKNESIIVLA